MSAPESATARLSRLLTMVPWLVNRQGIDIAQAAQELGVSPEQIEADLMLLFLCGTPGHMPDDLIDAEWESGRVYLRNADTIAQPLRLGRDEALALMVGLRTLLEVPGLGERDAVERALAKLSDATGDAAAETARVRVALTAPEQHELLARCRQALHLRRRLHLRYLVASRDEATEREVDPMRLLNMNGHWYLEGWCHRAEGQRMFRLDRIDELSVLEVDGTPPDQAQLRELDGEVFRPSEHDLQAQVRLTPAAAWVVEYYPVEQVEQDPHSDDLLVRLRVSDAGWLVSLVHRLGGAASVVAPPELAEEVRTVAQQALAGYC